MKRPSKHFLWIVPVLILCFFVPQIPGYIKISVPKSGRVIDHDTGEGVSSATVIVKGIIGARGFWASGGVGCTYFTVNITDDHGYFSVPSQFSKASFGFPGTGSNQWWTLVASKDGYIQSDVPTPLTFNSLGRLEGTVLFWDSRLRPSFWKGLSLEIPPIELKQMDMSFEQQVAMFAYRGLDTEFGCRDMDPRVRDFLADAKQSFYLQQEQFVCGALESATTDAHTVSTLAMLAKNAQRFRTAMLDAGPRLDGQDRASDSYRYRLVDLCRAMKLGE